MKYVFLDIDGVLCTNLCALKEKHPVFSYPFQIDCVKIFNDIIATTDAEIILTSDWRTHFNSDIKRLDQLFKHNRVIKSPIAVTSDFGKNRNKEISTFVNKNKIKQFLILDDMPLIVHPLRFINTKLSTALIPVGIKERAIDILNTNQSNIFVCINCEKEYRSNDDVYTCSSNCRTEIEEIKRKVKNITDEEIKGYIMLKWI